MKVAYKVLTLELPKACKLFNHRESFFESMVTDIIPLSNSSYSIVVIDINGEYPYLTNTWKQVIQNDN